MRSLITLLGTLSLAAIEIQSFGIDDTELTSQQVFERNKAGVKRGKQYFTQPEKGCAYEIKEIDGENYLFFDALNHGGLPFSRPEFGLGFRRNDDILPSFAFVRARDFKDEGMRFTAELSSGVGPAEAWLRLGIPTSFKVVITTDSEGRIDYLESDWYENTLHCDFGAAYQYHYDTNLPWH